MPHRTTKAIGERGKTNYNIPCPICRKPVAITGHVLRDLDGCPLNKANMRFDYLFPDGSSEQGVLCNTCNDNHRNKVPLSKDKNGKWNWTLE